MVLVALWHPRWPKFSWKLTNVSLGWLIMESDMPVLSVSWPCWPRLCSSDDVFPETVYAVLTFDTAPRNTMNKLATSVRGTSYANTNNLPSLKLKARYDSVLLAVNGESEASHLLARGFITQRQHKNVTSHPLLTLNMSSILHLII